MSFLLFVYVFSAIGSQAYAGNLVSDTDKPLQSLYEQQVRSVKENLAPIDTATTALPKDTNLQAKEQISTSDIGSELPQTQADYVEGEILVKYKISKINLSTSSGKSKALSFMKSKSLQKEEDLKKINTSILRITDDKTVEEKVAELKKDPNVEYAQPNFQYYPATINANDTNVSLLWGLDNLGQTINGSYGNITGTTDKDIDAPEAWAINEGTNSSVILAIIDSGVAYNHPDLIANMWDGTNCKDENGSTMNGCNHGYDYEDNDKTPLPTTSSHGTHIAGTIGAVKNNGKGIMGVAPNIKIMAIKSSLTTAEIVKGINFAKQNGAKIINASWGSSNYDQALKDGIDSFTGLFIVSAGNCGDINTFSVNGCTSQNQTLYPASFDSSNIISVAATDQNDNLADFSNFSSTSIDVGAPGTNIYSTVPSTDLPVMSENFDGVTAPSVPSGWAKTGNWGTYNYGGTIGNVLYGDAVNVPYAQTANSTTTSSTYNLSNGGNLDFWTRCDTEYSTTSWTDYMSLEFSSNGGSTFTEVLRWDEPYLDSDTDPAGSAVYHFENLSIPTEYLTNNFKMRFRWVANGNTDTGNGDGCFVDDMKITRYSDGSDEKYAYEDGTSMAAPHVAGLAALIWGYKPELTYTQVKDTILNTGDSVASLSGKTVSGKRINAFNALNSLAPATHIISGTVKYYDGIKAIPSATVTLEDAVGTQLATTTTDANGAYQFTGVANGGNYVVKVSKGSDTSGLSSADQIKIGRHIVGLELFDTIFKIIAGDVNNSGSLTSADQIKIGRFIVGLDSVLTSGAWKFYPSSAALDATNYLTSAQTRTYSNLIADMTGQDFVGVKMGDVNKSW